jgi:hypothetical protein
MPNIRPEPESESQKLIAGRIDGKAKAIAEGSGRWKPGEIIAEMKFAVPIETNRADDDFAMSYLAWRSKNPLTAG